MVSGKVYATAAAPDMSDHGRSDAFKLRAVAGTIKVQDGFPTLTNHTRRVALMKLDSAIGDTQYRSR
jgi:hypothetical protein